MTGTAPSDIRWQYISDRRIPPDDPFVYGVITTGIYCRPDCPARRPARHNVRFFDNAALALKAGFRACLRCKPDQPPFAGHIEMIMHACQMIETAESLPCLDELATAAGLSPGHFQRVFKRHIGLSPKQYAIATRKQRLRQVLPHAPSVTAAIYDAGYNNPGRAYENKGALGMTHRAYQSGGNGTFIHYAGTQTSLGPMLVAATARGICMVEFGPIPELVLRLQQRFPKATITPMPSALQHYISGIIDMIDTPAHAAPLPLDMRGTVFQEKIWRALTEIPVGETRSYSDIARSIGAPQSARAVARACASNHIAIAIPCHRVVREDGSISGYRWGVSLKKTLLARERSDANDQ